jgi:hypothetical protein
MRKTLQSNNLQLTKWGGNSRHPDILSKVHHNENELLRGQNTCYNGKITLLVKSTIEGALLYTCRIEELGNTICVSLSSTLIEHPGLRDVQMAGMTGIAPRSSDQQPETFIQNNDTIPPEVVSEPRQLPHYVETISYLLYLPQDKLIYYFQTGFSNPMSHE